MLAASTLPTSLRDRIAEHRAAIYRAGHVASDAGTTFPVFPVGLTQPAADALRDLVVRERALRTLETGLGLALSALAIAEGLLAHAAQGEVAHLVIEPAPQEYDHAGVKTLERSGADAIVRLAHADSTVQLPRLVGEGAAFDFAYLDGGHWFEYVFCDLFNALRLVRSGGLIVLDDHWMPSVQMALAFFTSNLGVRLELFDPAGPAKRFVALRVPAAPAVRDWQHFADFTRRSLPAYPWRGQEDRGA